MIKGDLAHRVDELLAARQPFVQATVVRAAAPTSVRPGDSALVLADGTIDGFVGGMCAQASVRLHAVRAMETGETILLRLVPGRVGGVGRSESEDDPLAQNGVVVVNNPCLSGGALEIFLEPLLPAARVVIAGATPIAVALEQVARAAGFDAVHCEPAEVAPHATDAALVVASHGTDEEAALARALEAGVGYVGLVASRRRGEAVREALDVPDALRALVHTPAGLDIGARTPAEIAVSILAQIVAERTAGERPQPAEQPPLAITMPATATDPICGMEVVAAEATVHLDEGGRRVYFCCEGCRSTYAADPLRHGGE
ncbi:MAG: xanthine dehydrogenase accessory factor [Solirubrobacteraceae bacterium]|nr:xanthine dehydrogenase accessory factor [Solirubrobacteraceae bacterium]